VDWLVGIALVVVGYLLGSIPFAIVVGKGIWHVDVRDHGSGNVGTTNVFRVLGRKAGTLVLIGDMAKGWLPVFVAAHLHLWVSWYHLPAWFPLLVAAATMLGHMFSVFLRGGGGKGVATGAGATFALVPWIFVISLTVFLVVLLVGRMVSLASLCAALTLAISTSAFDKPPSYQVLAWLAVAIVFWAHRSNIRRIALRCENKVTFPWNKKAGAGGDRAAGQAK
jgi:glycerol-3-phosphate acyltransferase PlsY